MKRIYKFLILLIGLVILSQVAVFAAEYQIRGQGATVTYYTYVNGVRQAVSLDQSTIDSITITKESGSNRYYITAENLEKVYGDYGFKASEYNGERIFPHTDNGGPDNVWADAAPYQRTVERDGQHIQEWRIPLATRDRIYVYYLPRNIEENKSYFTTSKSISDEGMIEDNTFYSIRVSGSEAGASDGTYYTLNGEKFSITLSQDDEETWMIFNGENATEIEPDQKTLKDGRLTIAFNSVSCPIKITNSNRDVYNIKYNTDTLEYQYFSGEITTTNQSVLQKGTIDGKLQLEETINFATHETFDLKIPDTEWAVVGVNSAFGQEKQICYFFRGWRVKGTNIILNAEEPLTKDKAFQCEQNGVLELEAVWDAKDGRDKIQTVNFYLSLNCEVKDYLDNGFNSIPTVNFTKSLFATGVYGTDRLDPSKNMLIAPPSGENAYATDQTLRELPTDSIYGVTLAEFPSDEEIFKKLRDSNQEIKIDGERIPSNYINSDFFQVRWYVLKYEEPDGWHIDGVLVAKEGKIRVTKSFRGDPAAIQDIKSATGDKEFGIKVHKEGLDFLLTLKPETEEPDLLREGYSSYDPETETYTWILTGSIDADYTFAEQNFLSESKQTASYYRVRSTVNPGAWNDYSTGTTITSKMNSYAQDVSVKDYKTIEFRNYYVTPQVLRVHKVDSFSNNGLANVSFKLESTNPKWEMQIYRKPGTSEYSYAESTEYSEAVSDNIVTTDKNGNLYLNLSAETYTLEETFPDGYSGASKILFTVDARGKLTELTAYDGNGVEITENENLPTGKDTSILTVPNHSKRLTSVKVQKDWSDTPENQQKEVKVTLLCDGLSLDGTGTSETYTQVLNAANGWSYTWENLPLFIDGEVARYRVKEIQIGDAIFDSTADEDGYRDYIVTYDAAQYRDDGEKEYTHEDGVWTDGDGIKHYANHVLLKLHNKQDTVSINGIKEWEDFDNKYNTRPESITLQLIAKVDGKQITLSQADYPNLVTSVTTDASKGWKWKFSNLPKYRGTHVITYSVKEVNVSGYTSAVTIDKDGVYTVTNTLKLIDIKVNKKVHGNMGDVKKAFPFEVTIKDAAGKNVNIQRDGAYDIDENGGVKFDLKHDESVTLKGVPFGAVVILVETEAEEYNVSISTHSENLVDEYDSHRVTVGATEGLKITVTNTKNVLINSGVPMRTMPYVIALQLALVCGILWLLRKGRRTEE